MNRSKTNPVYYTHLNDRYVKHLWTYWMKWSKIEQWSTVIVYLIFRNTEKQSSSIFFLNILTFLVAIWFPGTGIFLLSLNQPKQWQYNRIILYQSNISRSSMSLLLFSLAEFITSPPSTSRPWNPLRRPTPCRHLRSVEFHPCWPCSIPSPFYRVFTAVLDFRL